MGGGGLSSLSDAGSGDGVSLVGLGRAGWRWCVSAGGGGGGGWWKYPCCLSVVGSWGRGVRGGESLGVAPLVVGWAWVGVVLDRSLDVPPGLVGGVCACREGLVAPGWTQ